MAGEGGTPSTSNTCYYENGSVPFIKIEDLKQKYLASNKDHITELGLQKSSAWLIPTNSILFSNGATIGEISITTYPVCTKQGIWFFRNLVERWVCTVSVNSSLLKVSLTIGTKNQSVKCL